MTGEGNTLKPPSFEKSQPSKQPKNRKGKKKKREK
jgi:hypothetical protein